MERQGVRIEWADVPATVRLGVEEMLGAAIVTARNAEGGFSPGPAARCDLSDGRRVFIKAAGTALNPATPAMHRREAHVLSSLPDVVPAPTLIGSYDDGDWVALVTEFVEAAPPTSPLAAQDTARVLRLADRLAEIGATCDNTGLTPFADAHADLSGHWAALSAEPLTNVDPLIARHLDELVNLEADVADATRGECLLHVDLRIDNMLFGTNEADDMIVDWPGACRGASWVDVVAMLPSLHLDGGPSPVDALSATRAGSAADPAAVDTLIATIAGYFVRNSLQAPPPGLPTVRAFQAAQGEVALDWLRTRRSWA